MPAFQLKRMLREWVLPFALGREDQKCEKLLWIEKKKSEVCKRGMGCVDHFPASRANAETAHQHGPSRVERGGVSHIATSISWPSAQMTVTRLLILGGHWTPGYQACRRNSFCLHNYRWRRSYHWLPGLQSPLPAGLCRISLFNILSSKSSYSSHCESKIVRQSNYASMCPWKSAFPHGVPVSHPWETPDHAQGKI